MASNATLVFSSALYRLRCLAIDFLLFVLLSIQLLYLIYLSRKLGPLYWIVVNILLANVGLQSFDQPPFIWLQGLLSLGALLQATMILITQNRQDEATERSRQLDLQVSLLLDQKMSKLITMVDELRQAHPALKESTDPQIEALKKTVDPHQSLETLNQLLDKEEQK